MYQLIVVSAVFSPRNEENYQSVRATSLNVSKVAEFNDEESCRAAASFLNTVQPDGAKVLAECFFSGRPPK